MSCYCDNCILTPRPNPCSPPLKTLEELKQEVREFWGEESFEEEPKKCPGYTTSLVAHVCGVELDEDEDDVCESCQVNYLRQLDYEDDAAERALQRQLDNEEYQLLRLEDTDGDDVEF